MKEQVDELVNRNDRIPAVKRKTIAASLGIDPAATRINHEYQKHAENAIYANPRIK